MYPQVARFHFEFYSGLSRRWFRALCEPNDRSDFSARLRIFPVTPFGKLGKNAIFSGTLRSVSRLAAWSLSSYSLDSEESKCLPDFLNSSSALLLVIRHSRPENIPEKETAARAPCPRVGFISEEEHDVLSPAKSATIWESYGCFSSRNVKIAEARSTGFSRKDKCPDGTSALFALGIKSANS